MSGPENLRGVDYQISTSMLLILKVLSPDERTTVSFVRFDSLDSEGEDLAFNFTDGSTREIQIKKLAEGYNWTAASIRPVLSRFARIGGHECVFITDGSASQQVQALSRYLSGNYDIDDELQRAVCGEGLDLQALQSLRGRTRIETRFFPSGRSEDPAGHVREEVRKLINRASFSLTTTADEAESALWLEVYSLARESKEISLGQCHEILARCGIRVQSNPWGAYPTPRQFYEHEISADQLANQMVRGGILLLTGIGGSGKTSVAAEASARASSERRVCWITMSELLEPADVIRTVADYAAATALPDAADRLRAAEAATLVAVLGETVTRRPVAIVLDRFETANERTKALIRDALATLELPTQGTLVLTSREIPLWWPDIPGIGDKHISLSGMPAASANSLLADMGVGSDDAERAALMDAVGRHAQSLVLMAQISEKAALVQSEGIAAAREWLLRRVVSGLPETERSALARLAIFTYPAPIELASAVVGEFAPDAIRRLASRDLVRVEAHQVTVHDAIREAALALLSLRARSNLHRTAADEIFAELEHQNASEEGILYDDAIRWAIHLEATDRVDDLSDRIRFILDADAEQLRELFGVSYLGFPFDFEDPSLDSAFERLESMEDDGLIEENPANEGKEHLVEPAFILRGFSAFEDVLIRARCFHHGYAGQVGYMDDMRPNYTYRQHGLYCPWEHCIELMPLPPMSKAEWLEAREDDRKRLAAPEAAELDERVIAPLTERVNEDIPDWVVAEPDADLRARSCPVFGHACPNGKGQAQTCRSASRFQWAIVPEGWED